MYGVEIVETAIDDAKNNAVLNNISNAEFKCSDAGKYMLELVNQDQHLDVVFVDHHVRGVQQNFG
ncbi:MAG: methyltransferase domain-containing protein [Thomasclavelia ramosa]